MNPSLKHKVKWRLRCLLNERRGKSINSIFLNLSPFNSKIQDKLILREIRNNRKLKKLIKIKEGNGTLLFDFGLMKIKYPSDHHLIGLLSDYISLIYPSQTNERQDFLFSSLLEGPYEQKEVFLNNGDYVIDAGANVGLFSIFAGKKIGAEGKVFSFEPIFQTKKILDENIVLNDIQNIETFELALGGEKGFKKFSFDIRKLGGASGFFTKGKVKEKVRTITLGKFMKEKKVPKIDFIKADIEGMERNFLKGAERTIKKFKPKISICSYHRPDDPRILEEIIKGFVPGYHLIHRYKKIYAWLP